MTRTINVKNISASVPDEEVRRFFSFCGQIDLFDLKKEEGKPSSAKITYTKESSAGTAALLNETDLGGHKLEIERLPTTDVSTSLSPEGERNYEAETDVPQEHKPRGRVFAELLAQGYAVGDRAIAQAIELDKTHGISTQFETWLKELESKYKPQERARDLDSKYDLTGQVAKLVSRWRTYFEKPLETASNTAIGIQLRRFYDSTMKTVQSVHEEAQYIKEQKYSQKCGCQASAEACTCTAGSCACDDCPKNIYAHPECCKADKDACCSESKESCSKGECKKTCSKGQCKDGECSHSKCKEGECAKGECKKSCPKGQCTDEKSCQKSTCACDDKPGDCGCATVASACVCEEGQCKCAGCEKASK